jgi:hypothetical protein
MDRPQLPEWRRPFCTLWAVNGPRFRSASSPPGERSETPYVVSYSGSEASPHQVKVDKLRLLRGRSVRWSGRWLLWQSRCACSVQFFRASFVSLSLAPLAWLARPAQFSSWRPLARGSRRAATREPYILRMVNMRISTSGGEILLRKNGLKFGGWHGISLMM